MHFLTWTPHTSLLKESLVSRYKAQFNIFPLESIQRSVPSLSRYGCYRDRPVLGMFLKFNIKIPIKQCWIECDMVGTDDSNWGDTQNLYYYPTSFICLGYGDDCHSRLCYFKPLINTVEMILNYKNNNI